MNAEPDCIASNDSHDNNSLLMYKSIESSKKSVMECVFVKCDKNIIIHYHKIKNKEINEGKKLLKINYKNAIT